MAAIPPTVEGIVRAYVREVAKVYQVSQVIVFGSYARGTAHGESDIDVVIVSPDFRTGPEMEVLEQLSRIAARVSSLLEVLALTPEDLQSPDPRSFPSHMPQAGIALAA